MSAENRELLMDLLGAEDEESVVKVLKNWKLFSDETRWRPLGDMGNNMSIVQNQQSNAMAALVEKLTNSIDAILMRHVQAKEIDPRSKKAPQSMAKAVELAFGDITDMKGDAVRKMAEEHLVLYATGSKSRPCLNLYDNGEGQLAKDFPSTFCSLIHGESGGSYKGSIPFVQGRFNMGATGVLPYCSDEHHFQLIVSRRAPELVNGDSHEWAFTLFRFFKSPDRPGWSYLVAPPKGNSTKGAVLTAGSQPLGLVPERGVVKPGQVPLPRERKVTSGTLIKLYEYKPPKSNICGELFKKLEDYLIQPALPMRIIECRPGYRANVMAVNVWDRLAAWGEKKLEPGFEKGASFSIVLPSTKEVIPGSIRVFRLNEDKDGEKTETELPTGLRAVINGQSHAKRDASFFKVKAVNLEHIAGSMLVTLDCSSLSQASRNSLFMSNRETFREDHLLTELFKKVQDELRTHEELIKLNEQRYEEKLKNAVTDNHGVDALEELLQTDPELADLFGSLITGKVAAPTATAGKDGKITTSVAVKFVGKEFPTFFRAKDGSRTVEFDLPLGGTARPWFSTDVQNDYFSRRRWRGSWKATGDKFVQGLRLFNGRLFLTCVADKAALLGSKLEAEVEIKDKKGSGPFRLVLRASVVEQQEKKQPEPRPPRPPSEPKADATPSRPDIIEVDEAPTSPPIVINRHPQTGRLQLLLNRQSELLTQARALRPPSEHPAVDFVFKYGLALVVMGLLDQVKGTDEWKKDDGVAVRQRIQDEAKGIARVIVPLCLSLPSKLRLKAA